LLFLLATTPGRGRSWLVLDNASDLKKETAMTAKIGTLGALGGLALGAGLMYVLDPDRGAARRTRLRRQLARSARKGAVLALEARRVMKHPARLFA
jgi:hypothetical protein